MSGDLSEKTKGVIYLISFAIVGMCGLWCLGANLLGGGSPTPTPFRALQPVATSAPTTRTIVYSITGLNVGNRAGLTYTNAQGGTEQVTVTLPWTKTITVPRGQFVYISAQNQDAFGGVTCDITADGQSFKHSTSQGEYVIASCSGSAP